jgi:hypothetical protein
MSWSHGKYLPVYDVEKAFGLKEPLARPSNVGPSQPFPYSGIYFYGIAFTIFTIFMGILFFTTDRKNTVFDNTYQLASSASTAGAEEGQIFFSKPFTLKANQNVEISASAEATNFWLGIDGNLVDEQTGLVQGFSLPVEYYAGVDDGESWTEGSKASDACLSALPEGEYSMRLEVHGNLKNPPMQLHVRVRQNVPRLSHWLVAMLAVTAIPLAVGGYHIRFESRRWSDSNIADGESDNNIDDEDSDNAE